MSESYPSWLPKRPPPPAPASTFQSSTSPHPRAEDVFYNPGRKPTPRSVRIVARDIPWREATGDSADTRVQSRSHPAVRSSSLPPPLPPPPRFKAPSLHLSLLRSPALSMRIQYMLHPVSIFGHLVVQTYFDYNVVFMLIQVSTHPGPDNSPRNWSLAAAAYITCYVLQLFGVFFLYEVVYSFWRRWRVKRPLMLPLYFSTPGHNLVALTTYTNFCFFAYIRRSARPPWSSLASLFSSSPSSPSPSPSPSPSDSPSTDSAFSDYIAEWCFWRSQNVPTVALLLPRAALSLSLLLDSQGSGVTGRDSTYFDANGALSGYARGVLLANAAWTAWRALVLLGSVLALWILSGTACAGLCGPRYRWEERGEQDIDPVEKRMSQVSSELTYPYTSDDDGQGMSDGWSWKQGTRERVRQAWEFCLTNVRPGRGYATSNVRAREKPEHEEFAGLDEVLAAAGFAAPRFPPQTQRSVLSGEFFTPAAGKEALSDIIPPADEAPGATDAYGSQRSRRSDPLRVLPYPFKEFQTAKLGDGSGADKAKEKEVTEASLIPFPSPAPTPEDDADEDVEGDLEEGEGGEDEEEVDEEVDEDMVEGRRTSESMSSLGRPVNSNYPFALRRPTRSSASASHGTPSHRTPHSMTTSPSHSQSTPSTRGSRSTPSSRGLSRSTLSNKESTDSPRSPASAGGQEGAFIPPPPRHPRRRRRAGTAPSLPSSPLPDPGPSQTGTRLRTRTISASNSSSSRRSRGFDPEPEAVYESDEGVLGRVPSPVADGSQEEAEKEDSVGLLSAAPSPKASLAGIRQRSSNLSHRRGNGSRSSSSVSPAGSQGRSASVSGSARSRAQSLIHSLSQRASLGEFGTRTRSRSSSIVRNEESPSDSPRSAATGTGTGSGSHRVSHSASGSASGTGSGRPSGEGPPGIENTFGRPGELMSRKERLERLEAGDAAPSEQSPLLSIVAETTTGLRHAASEMSGVASSEATERLQVPPSEMEQSRTDISTANQSFVTAPMTVESTTEEGSGQSVSTWAQGFRHHVPGGTWGHEPA